MPVPNSIRQEIKEWHEHGSTDDEQRVFRTHEVSDHGLARFSIPSLRNTGRARRRKRRAIGVGGLTAAAIASAGLVLIQSAPLAASIPAEVRNNRTVTIPVDCSVGGQEALGTNSGSPDYPRAFTQADPISQTKSLITNLDIDKRVASTVMTQVRPDSAGKDHARQIVDSEGKRRGVIQFYGDEELGWQVVHMIYC